MHSSGKEAYKKDPDMVTRQAMIHQPPQFPWHLYPVANERTEDKLNLGKRLLQSLQHRFLFEIRRPGMISSKDSGYNPATDPRAYLISNGTLWAPKDQEICLRQYDSKPYRGRVQPFQEMVQSALNVGRRMLRIYKNATAIHPHLQKLINDPNLVVPIIVNPGDGIEYKCHLGSSSEFEHLLPIFAWAMDAPAAGEVGTKCVVSFALPGYLSWKGLTRTSRFVPNDWQDGPLTFRDFWIPTVWDKHVVDHLPWEKKIPKAIWRGSTTGFGVNDWRELPRAKLVNQSLYHADVLDAGFTKVVQAWKKEPYNSEIKRESRIVSEIRFMDFMRYKAVVDIDGNAWSARYGGLLCLNSVIIKVDPLSMNYFGKELEPWKHYVPVHGNLSDIVEKVSYVVDEANDAQMQTIIRNANEWCHRKMTVTQHAIDVLWILLSYLDVLLEASSLVSPSWMDQWQNISATYKLMETQPNTYFR